MSQVQQNTIIPFLRKIVVTVGAGGDLLQFVSDGTPNGLKVTCNISKTVMGIPNPSTVTLYNLSSKTRNAIQKSLSQITVEAGWENTEMHAALRGNVMSCVSERNGPDIVTKLAVLQGYNATVQAVTSKTYAEGMPIKEVVKDLGSQLPGITVNETLLKDVQGTVGYGGWSFAGQTKDALTQLANEYGFSWTIDDEALRVVGDKAKFSGVVVLDGNEGGLINVSPILNGPMQVQTGVKIKAIYVPGVVPGATVRVRSTLSEGLDGDYRIHTSNYSLDTYSDSWTMDLESFKYM